MIRFLILPVANVYSEPDIPVQKRVSEGSKVVTSSFFQYLPLIVQLTIVAVTGVALYFMLERTRLNIHERWILDELRNRNETKSEGSFRWSYSDSELIDQSQLLWKLVSGPSRKVERIIKFVGQRPQSLKRITIEQKAEICCDLFLTIQKFEAHLKQVSVREVTPIVLEVLENIEIRNLHIVYEARNYTLLNSKWPHTNSLTIISNRFFLKVS